MRPYRITLLAITAVLAGCHGTSSPKSPTDAVALYKDLEAKFADIPKAASETKYDLRSSDGPANLKKALEPYNSALDEAQLCLKFGSYPEAFIPVTDFVIRKVVPPGSKNEQDIKLAAFLKRLVKALCARARLEYVNGQTEKGLNDFKSAAHTVQIFAAKEGSLLAMLITVATTEIVLRATQETAVEASLEKNEFSDLARVVVQLSDGTSFSSLVRGEQSWAATHKTDNAKSDAREQHDLSKIVALFAHGDEDTGALLPRFKALFGSVSMPTNAEEIASAGAGPVLYNAYLAYLRGRVDVHLTVAFLSALDQHEKSGHFPASLPIKGDSARDSFGDGTLKYQRVGNGFTVSSPASRGYVVNPVFGDVYHVTYPTDKYLSVSL